MKQGGGWSSSITLMYQAARMEEERKGRTSFKKVFPELPHNSSDDILLARTLSHGYI